MLSVDCWRRLVFILGTHKNGGGRIIALSAVCKNAYRAVRENGTQFLRWKMNQDFVTNMAQNQYPWFAQIRAVTVSFDNMEYFWIRTSRRDIKDVKVLLTKPEKYVFGNDDKTFVNLKYLNVRLGLNTKIALASLPDGIETFKIERENMYDNAGFLVDLPEIFPDSLRVLKIYVDYDTSYGRYFPPNLRVIKAKSYVGTLPFDVTKDDNKLEKMSCVRFAKNCLCDQFLAIEGVLNRVKKLTYISRGYCGCRLLYLNIFPALNRLKTNKFNFNEQNFPDVTLSNCSHILYNYDDNVLSKNSECHKITFRHRRN